VNSGKQLAVKNLLISLLKGQEISRDLSKEVLDRVLKFEGNALDEKVALQIYFHRLKRQEENILNHCGRVTRWSNNLGFSPLK
jgi:hypothetical protein